MNLIVIAALIAVCGAAKLDRTYLPPSSAQTAGGSPGALQTPFGGATFRTQGNQGLGGIPKGAFNNDFGGVVVDAAAAGTRAAGPEESGLGAPRPSYGSQVSKVGDAAFRGAQVAGFRQFPNTPQDEDNVNDSSNGNPTPAFGDNRRVNQETRFQASNAAQFDRPSFNAEPIEAERSNADQDRAAGIVRYDSEVGTDSYSYAFETDNGISAEENGVVADADGVQAQGGFSYTGDDGQVYSVTYTADENGYHPKGDHLPTPPPIPDAILRSLEQNAKDEAAGLSDDGSYDAQKYNVGSDYNESDNNNDQYNRGQSNKASENGVTATTKAASGFASQHGVPSSERGQNLKDDQRGSDFNAQASFQNSQLANGFNHNGFSSPVIQKDVDNNAYAVASQSVGNTEPGTSFQGGLGEKKQSRDQPTIALNSLGQKAQGSRLNANGNNFAPQRQEQISRFSNQASSSTPNDFGQLAQDANSNFNDQSSGIKYDQQNQQDVGSGGPFSIGQNDFSQQGNGQASQIIQQTKQQTSSFGAPSDLSQSSGFDAQMTQSQVSFGTKPNTNNFRQQIPPHDARLGNFGYLPPKQNEVRKFEDTQTPNFPETVSSSSQIQGDQSSQELTDATSEIHPTKKPDTSLTTPFETSKFGLAPQQAANQNDQLSFSKHGSKPNNKFPQGSPKSPEPQSSFSNRPTNQGFGQFTPKGNAFPQSQNYRQQNTPVGKVPTNLQSSGSSFASFNSQQSTAPVNNLDYANEEQTTGVAYTDSAPTTETSDQFSKFDQTQHQFHQNSQSHFNQDFQAPKRPNTQVLTSTQTPFSQNSLSRKQTSNNGQDDSYYYKQPTMPFAVPVTNQNQFRGASAGQFNQVLSQPSFDSQSNTQFSYSKQGQPSSQPNFQSQHSSTKYPRPPTLPAPASTPTVRTESEVSQYTKGVTQASASSFASNVPSVQFNGGNTQRFPQRQQLSQSTQSFSRPQSQSFGQQPTSAPPSSNRQNQYEQNSNGINQYPGAQTFGQRFTNNQQLGQEEPRDESITDVPTSTYEQEVYQYNKPEEVFPAPSQDPTPQASEETPVQFEPQKIEENVPISQYQGTQSSPLFGQNVGQRRQFIQQNPQFAGASASFNNNGASASSVAGKGEIFGGPRSPPSFDEDTGYHY